MRNFRKVIALVLAVAMMLTTFTTAFAAEKTSAEKLNELGLLLVTNQTDLGKTLTRGVGIAMVLKALGYSQAEADASEVANPFTDTTGWVDGYAAIAYDLGITSGMTFTTFVPNGTMTQQQFVTFMLRALGYGKDVSWTDTANLAAEAGISSTLVDATFTKNDAAEVMFAALSAKTEGGIGDKLYTKLGLTNAQLVSVGLIPSAFAAVDVSLTNLKVATINFVGDVDKDSVTATTLKVFKGSDTTAQTVTTTTTPGQVAYIVDGSTIKVVFTAALAQSDDVKFTIEKVKGKDGSELAKVDLTATAKDVTAPYVVSVVAENAKTIVVTVSEPVTYANAVKVFDDVKIDAAKLVGSATVSADRTVITFVLNTVLAANTYSFTMESLTDYAGFKSVAGATSITVIADDAAPKVVSAEATSKNTVVVMFDENLQAGTGTIKIDDVDYAIGSTGVVLDGKKVTITLSSPLDASDAFVPVLCSYTKVKDVVGNEEKSDPHPTFTFKAVFDEMAPTATVTVKDTNVIKVVFSEDVDGFTSGDYELKNTASTPAVVGSTVAADGTSKSTFLITLTTPGIDATNYTLKILKDSVYDLSVIRNKVAEVTFTLAMNDKLAPTAAAVAYLVKPTTFRVTFSEAMNVASIADENNYLFKEASGLFVLLSTVTDATIVVAADAKSVDITVPTVTTASTFALLGVKDVSGTIVSDFNATKTIAAAVAFTGADVTITAKDKKTLEVVSTKDFSIVDPNSFILAKDGVASTTHYVTGAVIDSKDAKKVTLTLNSDLTATALTAAGSTLTVNTVTGRNTKDLFGTELTLAGEAVVDGIKASVAVSTTTGALVLTFDEAVTAVNSTLLIADIVLKNKDGALVTLDTTNVAVDGTYTNFTIVTISGLTADDTYTVEVIARNIKDLTGQANVTKGLAVTSQKIK